MKDGLGQALTDPWPASHADDPAKAPECQKSGRWDPGCQNPGSQPGCDLAGYSARSGHVSWCPEWGQLSAAPSAGCCGRTGSLPGGLITSAGTWPTLMANLFRSAGYTV